MAGRTDGLCGAAGQDDAVAANVVDGVVIFRDADAVRVVNGAVGAVAHGVAEALAGALGDGVEELGLLRGGEAGEGEDGEGGGGLHRDFVMCGVQAQRVGEVSLMRWSWKSTSEWPGEVWCTASREGGDAELFDRSMAPHAPRGNGAGEMRAAPERDGQRRSSRRWAARTEAIPLRDQRGVHGRCSRAGTPGERRSRRGRDLGMGCAVIGGGA